MIYIIKMIKVTIKTNNGIYESETRLPFKDNPIIQDWKNKVEWIVKVEADEDELNYLQECIHSSHLFYGNVAGKIHCINDVMIWRGDLAKFIIDNI